MKKKILIVDDDKIFAKILRDGIMAGGDEKYEVFTARDGNEGFSIAESKKPDLILSDLIMPNLGGIDFLKKLRAEPWGKEIPVIVATQLSDMEKMSQGMELGVHGYIIKSDYSIGDILAQVEDILR